MVGGCSLRACPHPLPPARAAGGAGWAPVPVPWLGGSARVPMEQITLQITFVLSRPNNTKGDLSNGELK